MKLRTCNDSSNFCARSSVTAATAANARSSHSSSLRSSSWRSAVKCAITHRRLADGQRAYSIVERSDGVRYRVHEGISGPETPHALVHLVVEHETAEDGGFWGAVAAGAVFGSMEHIDGRRPPHSAQHSNRA